MRELVVSLRFAPDDVRRVGVLAEAARSVWFEFDPAYEGPELSPYALPRDGPRLREHRASVGVPIPGVFNDARPDGWGLRLLHRAFQIHGRPASSVSALEELAWLGDTTMGALAFEPATGPSGRFDDVVALAALAAHARKVYEGAVEDVLPELIRAGGSPGGARPKALVALRDDDAPGVRFGEGEIGPGWHAWLVKFPAPQEDRDVGRREKAWMDLAEAAGIDVPPRRVLGLRGVGDAFAVRRFDRGDGGARAHILSAAGALDADFRTAFTDYRELLRLTARICAGDQTEVAAMFRRCVFNVVASNDDDHLKNFAFRLTAGGPWRLAPGYDLTFSPAAARTTTVLGVERDVDRPTVLALAAAGGLPARRAVAIVDEVVAAAGAIGGHARAAGATNRVSRAAVRVVEANAARLAGA